MKRKTQLKKLFINCYYLVITSILAIQAISTVYQLSMNAGYNFQLAEMQKQEQVLNQEKNILAQKISFNKSITQAGLNYPTADYIEIAKPIIISSSTNLASR